MTAWFNVLADASGVGTAQTAPTAPAGVRWLGVPIEIWTALIAASVGGVVVKLVGSWFKSRDASKKVETVAAEKLRDDLARELAEFRGELRGIRAELDQWRSRYFLLFQRYGNLKNYLMLLNTEMRLLLATLPKKEQRDKLQAVLDTMPDIADTDLDPLHIGEQVTP